MHGLRQLDAGQTSGGDADTMTDDKLTNISRALGFALAVIVLWLSIVGWLFGR